MSIAEKLLTVAENEQKVYEAGKQAEYDRFWDDFQKNGTRTNYWYGFSGYGWTQETLNPKYKITFNEDSTITQYATGMFYRCGGNVYVNTPESCIDFDAIKDKFDFSGLKSARDLFNSCCMINIYADLSNCTVIHAAFARSWGGYLNNITIKVSDKLTDCVNMFQYSNATNITFTDDSVIACNGMNFSSCDLTHDSILSIINALQDKTSVGGTWTVTLGTKNLAKLTDAEKAIAAAKKWTLA